MLTKAQEKKLVTVIGKLELLQYELKDPKDQLGEAKSLLIKFLTQNTAG